EEVFRAAHSLKGTARMLGVTGVETLAHHLEDELGDAKRGRADLSPATIDRMYSGVDAIRQLCDEAVTGIAANVHVETALARLQGKAPLEGETPPETPDETSHVEFVISDSEQTVSEESSLVMAPPSVEPSTSVEVVVTAGITAPDTFAVEPSFENHTPDVVVPSTLENESHAVPEVEPVGLDDLSPDSVSHEIVVAEEEALVVTGPDIGEVFISSAEADSSEEAEASGDASDDNGVVAAGKGDFRIQTMRVPPAKLDALMTLGSELTVTTNRVTRGLATFAQMGELWEEWNKDLTRQQPRFSSHSSSGSQGQIEAALQRLAAFHEQEQAYMTRLRGLWNLLRETIYEDVTRLGFVADQLEEGIRNVRLLPLSTIFNLFPRLVRDLARAQGKEVQLNIVGGETAADKRILEELKDPLMHMIRNAIDHGIELPSERIAKGKPRVATLTLRARQTATNVVVELQDDGRGLNPDSIKKTALKRRLHTAEELAAMALQQIQLLIFSPGFSTSPLVTDVSGRGVGLDVVRINVERLKG
ncbi:MAG TPA: Hpt domain-containing protein, partial [Abditibacteriaceae bacterium]